MDEPSLEYSRHAFDRVGGRQVSVDEIEAIVWNPMKRHVSHGTVEHHGYSEDGREIIVVTDRSETYVITVLDKNRRRAHRRDNEARRKGRRRKR